jgi:hypothetical protein
MHVPPVLAGEALKFAFEWLRRKVFRSTEPMKESELSREIGETPFETTSAFDRLTGEMIYRDGTYWKRDGSGPYCKVCLLKDHLAMPLDEGATRGVYACPVHETSYWSREYRERRANRQPHFRTWVKQRAHLEAQSRRRAGY